MSLPRAHSLMGPPTPHESEALARAWAELTAGVPTAPTAPPVEVTGGSGQLPSHLPVSEVAVAAVGTALRAASAFGQLRGGHSGPAPRVSLDRSHVEAAVCSERYFRIGGKSAGASFATLSRFWQTADSWIRTHANYPWHRRALLEALDLTTSLANVDEADSVEAVAAAAAKRQAADIEDQVFVTGGVAVALRTQEGWHAHPQGGAVAALPLIDHHVVGPAPPRPRQPSVLPMTGLRVLDLTRVIAGPVCTRYLGALGADVLRIDPPHLPDVRPGSAADTLLGKRSTFLDLSSRVGQATLHHLLDGADVVVHGYRPGALERFGLGTGDLATHHPGLVVVQLDAWGHSGPWSGRRGFDSIVQVACGIAAIESPDGSTPGALPCQLLDHGTGYLAAAAVLDGLRRQAQEGGTVVRSLSLARTAAWLTDPSIGSATARAEGSSPHVETGQPTGDEWLIQLESPAASVFAVAPPGALDGRRLEWTEGSAAYGADSPAWAQS